MNTPNREPAWCVGDAHDRPGVHRSQARRVGTATRDGGSGQVTAWLQSSDGEPTRVAVNASDGIGVTAEITLEDAHRLREHLDALLREAERHPRNERR